VTRNFTWKTTTQPSARSSRRLPQEESEEERLEREQEMGSVSVGPGEEAKGNVGSDEGAAQMSAAVGQGTSTGGGGAAGGTSGN
jgi:hypothetical protein